MKLRIVDCGLWISQLRNSHCAIRNGFTLLEVVVAMAIVGLGVVTLLEIFSLGLRLGARSGVRTEVATYGRQVMDEFFIRRGVGEGREEVPYGEGYRWRVDVAPFRDESSSLSAVDWELKEVTVEVRYRDGGRERQFTMGTLRLMKKKSP